ncbi:MAG: hypothetical protein JWL96_2073 [Sphingomonas bacterium]|uniref:hypothetical protein n=1 Tax=Sphingomonas bacterium TaxID=1895847 RepID=UPI0026214C9B|nr:hypothetical protein [Sphingomonas bacterium]MDB5710003.1 hypothetical protein [Sphingomonas bacterium]
MSDRDEKPNPDLPEPPATTAVRGRKIDVQHGELGNGPGYSGQEYDSNDFAGIRAMAASSEGPAGAGAPPDDRLRPDNGQRAFFDEKTGEVHGSGGGAGGGNPGEDFASDSAAGDGFPQTGRGSLPPGKKDAQER